MGLQERDHREDPAVVVAGLRQLGVGEDAAHVLLDGALGDPQAAVTVPPGIGLLLSSRTEIIG
jgi:hypothetical protein